MAHAYFERPYFFQVFWRENCKRLNSVLDKNFKTGFVQKINTRKNVERIQLRNEIGIDLQTIENYEVSTDASRIDRLKGCVTSSLQHLLDKERLCTILNAIKCKKDCFPESYDATIRFCLTSHM